MNPIITSGFNSPEQFDVYSVLDWQRNTDKPDDFQPCYIKTIKGEVYERCYWVDGQQMWFVKPLDLGDGYLSDSQVAKWCKDERKLETIKGIK